MSDRNGAITWKNDRSYFYELQNQRVNNHHQCSTHVRFQRGGGGGVRNRYIVYNHQIQVKFD